MSSSTEDELSDSEETAPIAKWKTVMRKQGPYLQKALTSVSDIRKHCLVEGLITDGEFHELYPLTSNHMEHNELLFKLIVFDTKEQVEKFIAILLKFRKYEELASKLLKDTGLTVDSRSPPTKKGAYLTLKNSENFQVFPGFITWLQFVFNFHFAEEAQ